LNLFIFVLFVDFRASFFCKERQKSGRNKQNKCSVIVQMNELGKKESLFWQMIDSKSEK
jgi:hypothetical protein